jgi:hypothetical protein
VAAFVETYSCVCHPNRESGLALYPDGLGDNVVRQQANSGAANEIWTLEPQGAGLFRLILPSEGKGLLMTERGVKAMPFSGTITADQQWKLTPNGDQTYRISPQRPGNTGNLYYSTDYGLTTASDPTNTPARFRLEAATCPVQLPADCNIRIVAKDGTGTETTTLTRRPGTPGQFLPLTLTVESLDNSPLTGLSYAWATPASGTATTPGNTNLTADQRGDYKLQLAIPGLAQTCDAYVSLSAKPCTERKPTYASCRSVNVSNPDAANTLPLLQVGDTFNAADYTVTVTEVTGGGAGGWSGTGTLEVTLLNGINLPVSVTFENAKLNDCYELVNGKVLTLYDPDWGNIVDVDLLGARLLEDYIALQAELLELLNTYGGTAAERSRITRKIAEVESFKAELAAADVDGDLKTAITAESTDLTAFATCSLDTVPGIRGGRKAACTYVPWVKIAQIVGAAAVDVLLSYTFKWLEIRLDGTPVDYGDYKGITGRMDWEAVTASAVVSGLSELIPFGGGRSVVTAMLAGGGGAAGSAFATELLTQVNRLYQPGRSLQEVIKLLNWQSAISAAKDAGLAAAVTVGLFTAARHPSVKNFVKSISRKIISRNPTVVRNTMMAWADVWGSNGEQVVDDLFVRIGLRVRPRLRMEGTFGAFRALRTEFEDARISLNFPRNVLLSPHHIPATSFMDELDRVGRISNYDRNSATCIQLEAATSANASGRIFPAPRGGTDRHSRTASYLCPSNRPGCPQAQYATRAATADGPTQVLREEVEDLIRIYEQDGIYSESLRQSLQLLVNENVRLYPSVFRLFTVR